MNIYGMRMCVLLMVFCFSFLLFLFFFMPSSQSPSFVISMAYKHIILTHHLRSQLAITTIPLRLFLYEVMQCDTHLYERCTAQTHMLKRQGEHLMWHGQDGRPIAKRILSVCLCLSHSLPVYVHEIWNRGKRKKHFSITTTSTCRADIYEMP